MLVENTAHKIREIQVKEVEIKEIRKPVFHGEATITYQIKAQLAYIREDGRTCGKLTLEGTLLSDATKQALQYLMSCLELDAAQQVFHVTGTEPDNTEPL